MGSRDVWDRTRALLADGKKQDARGLAHAAMDGEAVPGWGMAASAAVASAEGFQEFAQALLERVDPEGAQGVLWPLRLAVSFALDAPLDTVLSQAGGAATDVDWQTLEPLWRHAVEYGRIDVLQALEPAMIACAPVAAAARSALAQLRELLGRSLPVPGVGSSGAPQVILADLPPFRRASGSEPGRSGALEVALELKRLAGHRGGLPKPAWWPWRANRNCMNVAVLAAARGHLGSVPDDAIVVLADGQLDRHSRLDWCRALEAWSQVVILGLRVRDPAALDGEAVASLARHQPVGVCDLASRHLLGECGIDAFVTGPAAPASSPVERAQGLWADHVGLAPAAMLPALATAISASPPVGAVHIRQSLRVAGNRAETSPTAAAPRPSGADGESLASLVRARADIDDGPAPSLEEIQVALAVDDKLAEALPVVIESSLRASSLPLRFHVLSRGLSAADWRACRGLFGGRTRIDFYPFDAAHYGEQLRLIGHTTVSTLDRLLLPSLLGRLERVIYLDVDLVVIGDLAPLWHLDLGGRPLAAKPSSSPGTRWGIQMLYHALGSLPIDRAREIARWLHETGPMTFRAFNAGVLLMDLERMRSDRAVPLLLSLVTNCAMNDQDALNAYARSSYVELSPAWNAAPRQDDTQGAKIIHFVGPVKPWHDLYISRKFEFQRVRDRVDQRRRELGLA